MAASVRLLQGYYTKVDRAPDQRAQQVICEPGHYCTGGVNIACPAGTFGNASGLSTPACSGPCLAGALLWGSYRLGCHDALLLVSRVCGCSSHRVAATFVQHDVFSVVVAIYRGPCWLDAGRVLLPDRVPCAH